MYGLYPAQRQPMTGTNGLMVNSPAYPSPSTGALSMDKVKEWMDKTGPLDVKNKHWAMGVGALAVVGLVCYGKKNYWF